MSATTVPAGYLANQTLDGMLSAFAWLLPEQGVFKQVFGVDGNPANVLDPEAWASLHDDDGEPISDEVAYADARADALAARLLRLALDNVEIIRNRADFYENRALEEFARLAPGGVDG